MHNGYTCGYDVEKKFAHTKPPAEITLCIKSRIQVHACYYSCNTRRTEIKSFDQTVKDAVPSDLCGSSYILSSASVTILYCVTINCSCNHYRSTLSVEAFRQQADIQEPATPTPLTSEEALTSILLQGRDGRDGKDGT